MKTERLNLRKFSETDIDIVYEINNHPECIRFNGWDEMPREKCLQVIKNWKNKYDTLERSGVFHISVSESSTPLGMAFIVDHNETGNYEIGFRFRRSLWGNGYAQEITRFFMEYAQTTLNANSIFGEVHVDNINSCRIFDKLKFEKQVHPSGPSGVLYKYTY